MIFAFVLCVWICISFVKKPAARLALEISRSMLFSPFAIPQFVGIRLTFFEAELKSMLL